MKDTIRKFLQDIRETHQIELLYACEAGSRIWGYASEESDYDVRFIYAYSFKSYLKVDSPPAVIQQKEQSKLELHGWDLYKAMQLFLKSNPSLYEWVYSPLVYHKRDSFIDTLKSIIPTYYDKKKLAFHYFHLALQNSKKGNPSFKDMLHCVRGILSTKWLLEANSLPPLPIGALLEVESKKWKSVLYSFFVHKECANPLLKIYIEEELRSLPSKIDLMTSSSAIPKDLVNELIYKELRVNNMV